MYFILNNIKILFLIVGCCYINYKFYAVLVHDARCHTRVYVNHSVFF